MKGFLDFFKKKTKPNYKIIKGSNEYNISWDGRDNLGIKSYSLFYSTNNFPLSGNPFLFS